MRVRATALGSQVCHRKWPTSNKILSRAIVSPYMPTLLRNGVMFLLRNPDLQSNVANATSTSCVPEERWLLAKATHSCVGLQFAAARSGNRLHCLRCALQETLHAMGHVQYPEHTHNQPYPIVDVAALGLSDTAVRKLAGNVSWLTELLSFVLCVSTLALAWHKRAGPLGWV